jgi:hypothetical protein
VLAAGDYVLSHADPDADFNGLPQIASAIALDGHGARILRDARLGCAIDHVHTGNEFRVFDVIAEGALTLNDVTVGNGCADGGGSYNDGGAIKVESNGTLALHRSRVEDSQAYDKSGAIDISGSAVVGVYDSTIADNVAGGGAGGIGTGSSGLLTVERSLIAGNSAAGLGGAGIGAYSGAQVRVLNSTIALNAVTAGAGAGGGIGNRGTLELIHTSLVGNRSAGSLHGDSIGNAGTMSIKNSLISAGLDPADDCANEGAPFVTAGTNLTDSSGCAASVPASTFLVNLGLAPALAANGGYSLSYALMPDSPAIDAAPDCTDFDGVPVTEDQRGVARPDAGVVGADVCDVGAIEYIKDQLFANGFE